MQVDFVVAEPTIREMLYARGRLSLARMYVFDLEYGVDFSRMVDCKGSAFNCSKARWVEFVQKICAEVAPLLPVESVAMLKRLELFIVVAPVKHPESAVVVPDNVFRGQAVEA